VDLALLACVDLKVDLLVHVDLVFSICDNRLSAQISEPACFDTPFCFLIDFG
jgi:hypothetical protein